MKKVLTICLLLSGTLLSVVLSQQIGVTGDGPVEVQHLTAQPLSRFEAAEATQGAAAEGGYFYAVTNTAIGKYDKQTGNLVSRFNGARQELIQHMNTCMAEQGLLLCANSNYPEVPMASSIEVFETGAMEHLRSYSLGILEEGSLTWFDRLGDGWIAGFAHYSGRGGLPYKDQSFSSIVRYDNTWRRVGGWMIPDSVISRMDPMAASGGALGPDGLLYLTGHDLTEMYVLAAPSMGPKLVHVATIDIDLEGQAFSWDRSQSERIVFGISRPNRQVRSFRIPAVTLPDTVYPLNSNRVLQGLEGFPR